MVAAEAPVLPQETAPQHQPDCGTSTLMVHARHRSLLILSVPKRLLQMLKGIFTAVKGTQHSCSRLDIMLLHAVAACCSPCQIWDKQVGAFGIIWLDAGSSDESWHLQVGHYWPGLLPLGPSPNPESQLATPTDSWTWKNPSVPSLSPPRRQSCATLPPTYLPCPGRTCALLISSVLVLWVC